MKLAVTSDLHGHLPEFKEDFDVLVIAGDVAPSFEVPSGSEQGAKQQGWFETTFYDWMSPLDPSRTIVIGGNHDWALFQFGPEIASEVGFNYLRDSSVVVDGIKFYGMPYILNLTFWPFYKNDEDMAEAVEKIPSDTDVLITHNPPWGRGGYTTEWGELGFGPLRDKADSLGLKAHIFGHIHQGYGMYRGVGRYHQYPAINAAYVDEQYNPVNDVVYIEV